MPLPVLCVGALTLDTIFRLPELPHGPGKFIPTDAVQNATGMASSQAASIARLGGAVALWASVGDDLVGARLIAELEAEGVDCAHVRRVSGAASAYATILVDRHGERIVVPRYEPELTATPHAMPPINAAFYGAVMTDVRWPAAAAMALEAARGAGIPAILDLDTGPRDVLEQLAPLATHIVASEPGAALLAGGDSAADNTALLAERYGAAVAVTAGERGCYWFDRHAMGVRHLPGYAVLAVDTLAAGDVFHAGFALALVEGHGMAHCLQVGAAAAAIKCTRFGGRLGAPSRAEVEALLTAVD